MRPAAYEYCQAALDPARSYSKPELGESAGASRSADYSGINKNEEWGVVSLFSGCGGMDLGFVGGFEFLGKNYEKNPFKITWANEINPAACKTYSLNLGAHIVNEDISSAILSLPAHAEVIIGGFPCQDISINGKMQGIKGSRSSLYRYMAEAVRIARPLVFVAENVGGLLLKHNSSSLKTILNDFSSLGYDVSHKLYKTERYGVPQTRERVFIVGVKKRASPLRSARGNGRASHKRQGSHWRLGGSG